ncbi:MAG TPA: hypothetical protein VIG80_05155 [Bacillaceae bacterium]
MGRVSKVIRFVIKAAPIVYPIAKKIFEERKRKKGSHYQYEKMKHSR